MKVAVIMGSISDLKTMQQACDILYEFEIPYECEVVSAHRTPEKMFNYAKTAIERGISIVIAGAGGAAHLPGMVASLTTIPVIGVPIKSKALKGQDSLLSIVQMPSGIPVATVAIGGAKNAGLLAISMLSITNLPIQKKLENYRHIMNKEVEANSKIQ
ncbi:MAG: 5-(carboxyamino)imidazole ribonucleotide mutase [Candidatus Deianiraeaceae bacterium]|jgi:5-(carboxyamino)imidazole ribonucleotide mutase